MSFLAPTPDTTGTTSGSPRINTYRAAERLPLPLGFWRLAPKWRTDRFNDTWTNGSNTGQAFCSVMGAICLGPVAKIRGYYRGGEIAKLVDVEAPTDPEHPNYHFFEFVVGEDNPTGPMDIVRVYWGREDQPVDDWLPTASGQEHPAYRGQCIVIFKRLHCGTVQANSKAKPALPNIEFTGISLPPPWIPTGLRVPSAITPEQFRGVNLLSAIWTILTHKRGGIGLDDGLVNETNFATAIADMESGTRTAGGVSGALLRVSPVLTGDQEAESILNTALSYIDGWFYSSQGKLCVDWFPNDGTAPAPITVITEDDIPRGSVPNLKAGTLVESPTSIVVTCLEGDSGENDLCDAAVSEPVPFVRDIVGSPETKTFDRKWFTAIDAGAAFASRQASVNTIPDLTGEVSVRLDRAVTPDGAPLRPGKIFMLHYAPTKTEELLRVMEYIEEDAVVRLKVQRERGVASRPWTGTLPPRDPIDPPDPEIVTDFVVLQAACGLDYGLVILIHRTDTNVAGFNVYLDLDGNWSSGSTLLGQQSWCAKATLHTGVGVDDLLLTITGGDDDLNGVLGIGCTDAEQMDNTLLAIIEGEWISIGQVTSVSDGVLTLHVLRGRLQSAAAAHIAGVAVWIVRKSNLRVWEHSAFTAGASRHIKVQAYNSTAESALSVAQSVLFHACAVPTVSSTPHYEDLIDPALLMVGVSYTLGRMNRGGAVWLQGWPEIIPPAVPASDPYYPRRYREMAISGLVRVWVVEELPWDGESTKWAPPAIWEVWQFSGSRYYDWQDNIIRNAYRVSSASGTTEVGVGSDGFLGIGPGFLASDSRITRGLTSDGATYRTIGESYSYYEGGATVTLRDEETDESAWHRRTVLRGAYPWPLEWIPVPAVGEDEPVEIAKWSLRNPSSVNFFKSEGRMRITAITTAPGWEYIATVKLFRKPYGSTVPFTFWKNDTVSLPADETGLANVVYDIPCERGWETYVTKPVISAF